VEPHVLDAGHQRVEGRRWQLAAAALPALSPVGIERRVVFNGDVAGGQSHDLGPPSSGQDECQQDRPITTAGDGVGDDRQELSDLVRGETAGRSADRPGALDGVARVRRHETHPDQEPVERGQTRDPGADCRRRGRATGDADAVGVGQDVWRPDRVRSPAPEERPQHAAIGLNGSSRPFSMRKA